MKSLLRLCVCFGGGLLLSLLVPGTMMFAGAFGPLAGWLGSGEPLAGLLLWGLPDGFWRALSGVEEARRNLQVRSFLAFCLAILQPALLLAALAFRWSRPR
ncbi:hypothetical protein [Pseudomonas sp. RIT-PI-AD]|uniref:hypothetical protein n=1 Tax=Pseudomonas sp. RIT-PI-AD TaxID=3035294 RepID=UPI0021DAAA89|nr:hypothetical protein [Pseudomonas sp. RIT-PI-AD]